MSSRPLKITGSIAAFIAGMVLASSAISLVAPFPKIGNLARKYEHIAENGDKYSMIYVGSSRVFHEFIPQQFDAALAARGHEIHSLNFGQDGMWPPESLYMLRKILATKPRALRWVFIDLSPIKPLIPGSETTLRSVYWHDLRHTWMALRYITSVPMEGQRTLGEMLSRTSQHLSLWSERFAFAGAGSDRLQLAVGLEREKKSVTLQKAGFEEGNPGPIRGEDLKIFDERLAILRNAQPKPIWPVFRDALEDIIKDVRAAGAEPIFVVPANLAMVVRFSDWPPVGVNVFAFDDPNRFPQFYNPEHRCDLEHLDPQAAAEFTHALAERFAQFLEAGKK